MMGNVRRAMDRSAAIVHEQMKDGVSSLATIATIAPLVGVFGTVIGIANSFRGISGERSTDMAAVGRETYQTPSCRPRSDPWLRCCHSAITNT